MSNIARNTIQTALHTANDIHKYLGILLVSIFISTGLMWLINITGFKGVNLFVFFFFGTLILYMGHAPRALATGGIFGFIINALQDKDLSQGVVSGIKTFSNLVFVTLYGFLFMAYLLSVISFETSPKAFWYIVAGVILLGALGIVFNIRTRLPVSITNGLVLVAILFSIWSMVPKEYKEEVDSIILSFRSDPEPKVGPAKMVSTPEHRHNASWKEFVLQPQSKSEDIFVPTSKCILFKPKYARDNNKGYINVSHEESATKPMRLSEFQKQKMAGEAPYADPSHYHTVSESNKPLEMTYILKSRGECT